MSVHRSPAERAVRLWLYAFNFILMAIGLGLAAAGARRAMFVVLLVPVGFAPFGYARLRLHRALASVLAAHHMAWVAAAGILLDVVMGAQLLTARAASLAEWVNGPAMQWIGPVWFSAHALLFLGYTFLGLFRALPRLTRRAIDLFRWRPAVPAAATAAGVDLGRRDFLRNYGVVGAAAPFAISLSGVGLSYDFRVDQHEIELPNWPRELDGLRVAHLSDIHVGGAMDRPRLREVAALTNAAKPDVVVHTGDFLTHRSGDFDAPLYEALAEIAAPHGQWACLGNHDYDNPERFQRKLAEAGVTLLRNRVVTLDIDGQPLEILGLDYIFTRADRDAETHRVVSSLPPRRAPRLLLNHDPRGFTGLPAGSADLVFSGHTHGGHIGIQLGAHALTVVGLAGIPDQGVFRRGDMRMFVTRCVGFYGYPMRVGIPPEIALLVLRTPRPGTTA